jgi:ABC-type taurine transport system substrate-binding protein
MVGIKDIEFKDEQRQVSIKFENICYRAGPTCITGGKNPLTFLQDPQGTIDWTKYPTDADVVAAVQKGTGSIYQGSGSIIEIDPIFGETVPSSVS